jgi:hypothetical protein
MMADETSDTRWARPSVAEALTKSTAVSRLGLVSSQKCGGSRSFKFRPEIHLPFQLDKG